MSRFCGEITRALSIGVASRGIGVATAARGAVQVSRGSRGASQAAGITSFAHVAALVAGDGYFDFGSESHCRIRYRMVRPGHLPLLKVRASEKAGHLL